MTNQRIRRAPNGDPLMVTKEGYRIDHKLKAAEQAAREEGQSEEQSD